MTAAEPTPRERSVLDAAVTAFAEGGYYGTTTADIARAAGVSQPRIMQIFGSKLNAFLRAHEYAGDFILEALGSVAEQPFRPQVLGRTYVELVRTRPELLLVVFHAFGSCKEPAIAAEARRLFFAILQVVRDRAGADEDQARDFMARGMLINSSLAMRMGESDAPEQQGYLLTVLGAGAP